MTVRNTRKDPKYFPRLQCCTVPKSPDDGALGVTNGLYTLLQTGSGAIFCFSKDTVATNILMNAH